MKPASRMRGQYECLNIVDDTGQVAQRRCIFCGEVKAIVEFGKNGIDENGEQAYRNDCKVCYNVRRNENRTPKKFQDFIGGQRRRGEEMPELTFQEWKECVIFFGGECAYCGGTPRRGMRLTKDHLHPVDEGGQTVQSNIVPACGTCNSSKGKTDVKQWYMKQSFFSQERLNRIFQWRSMLQHLEE